MFLFNLFTKILKGRDAVLYRVFKGLNFGFDEVPDFGFDEVPSIMYCKTYKTEIFGAAEIFQIQDAGYRLAGTYHLL